ncbi:hypothetical protein ABKN59_008965 [Abortiporus biennis]
MFSTTWWQMRFRPGAEKVAVSVIFCGVPVTHDEALMLRDTEYLSGQSLFYQLSVSTHPKHDGTYTSFRLDVNHAINLHCAFEWQTTIQLHESYSK